MSKMYEQYFSEPLVECDCSKCEKRYECSNSNLAESCKMMQEAIKKLNETCPAGTSPRNGQCANKDGNSYRAGICDIGYAWDSMAGSKGKCVKHTEK